MGVSIVASPDIPLRVLQSRSHARYQLFSASLQECTIIAASISPSATSIEFYEFLNSLTAIPPGYGIIADDFNIRHTTWDQSTSRYGLRSTHWLPKQRLIVGFSRSSNCFTTGGGSSTVDLILAIGPTLPDIRVDPHTVFTDHLAVSCTASLSTASSVRCILLSLVQQPFAQRHAADAYAQSIPLSFLACLHAWPSPMRQTRHPLTTRHINLRALLSAHGWP